MPWGVIACLQMTGSRKLKLEVDVNWSWYTIPCLDRLAEIVSLALGIPNLDRLFMADAVGLRFD